MQNRLSVPSAALVYGVKAFVQTRFPKSIRSEYVLPEFLIDVRGVTESRNQEL